MPEITQWQGETGRGYRPAVCIRWEADEVPALYRVYRDHFGSLDGIVHDVFEAMKNDREFEESLDPVDAYVAAGALEDGGLPVEAERLRWMVGGMTPPGFGI